ncbi:MAG TPA: glutamate--tRNA ligase [Candidatus Paceibacterota bacterium]
MSKKVVTRFAPSPTGFLHIGGVRTALFAFLFARKNGGIFALRIEDTDKVRSKEEWTEGLVDDLEWLGLKHDVFVKQSNRVDIHNSYIKKLIDSGHAYISKEKVIEEGQRDEVIRFKNPNKKVIINDLIRGDVEVDTTDLGDFVIAKSLNEPVYHLAVVVDDYDMGITHVIRAEEHLSNTPRQILIQEGIGAPRPIYAHLPLVLAEDKSKLSKRKHGETVSLTYYRNKGYLSEAILNFVAMIGWNPGTDQEIFSLKELIENFDLEKVQKGGAVFNIEKLNWFNKKYIEKMSDGDFAKYAKNFYSETIPEKVLPLLKERISYFGEIKDIMENEFSFIKSVPKYNKESLKWKNETLENTKTYLEEIIKILEKQKSFSKEKVKESLWPLAEGKGKGNILWPMRYALSGREKSPDPFIIAEILGKKETLNRLNFAHDLL